MPAEFTRWINDLGLKNDELIIPGNDVLRDQVAGMDVKKLEDFLASHT